jgi:hypothetical protein
MYKSNSLIKDEKHRKKTYDTLKYFENAGEFFDIPLKLKTEFIHLN